MSDADISELMRFIAVAIAVVGGPVGVYVSIRVTLREMQSEIERLQDEVASDRDEGRRRCEEQKRDRDAMFALLRSIDAKIAEVNLNFAKQPGECAKSFASKEELRQALADLRK